ncbi:MAG: ABC transporter permease [Clostridium sp.]|nr:ABC transporter permease [Clostridium sp.]
MWKDYLAGYIKNNRASGISVIVSTFIAALFLSFLCTMFYNLWLDDVESVKQAEGDWHGRIEGKIGDEELTLIQNFANVELAAVNRELSGNGKTLVDIRFSRAGLAVKEMPLIAEMLGVEEGAASYNLQLLSLYFVRVPGDEKPRLLLPFYFFIVLLLCFSMILVIHNSFAVSMNAKIRQFGIFSSVGTAPGQIRACLLQEAAALAALPTVLGILSGIVLSMGIIKAMGVIARKVAGGHEAVFSYHPVVLGLTVLAVGFTVLFSAWIPARKLGALTPLEAIKNTGELQLKRKKRAGILAFFFGAEGELAANALKAQKKALRSAGLSLTLAFLGFSIMQSFFALSDLSTQETYFERYKDTWDVMVTVKDRKIEAFDKADSLGEIPGANSVVVYQKAAAFCLIPEEWKSKELAVLPELVKKAGGAAFQEAGGEASEKMSGEASQEAGDAASKATGDVAFQEADDAVFQEMVDAASQRAGVWQAGAQIVVIDDAGFAQYCRQIGVEPELEGVIILNKIWNSIDSNFRKRSYVPYVKEDRKETTLLGVEGEKVTLPILAYAEEEPVLREEYNDYELVHFVPLSLWKKAAGGLGGNEKDIFVRGLSKERQEAAALDALEAEILAAIGGEYEMESENRIGEQKANEEMISGYKLMTGSFCVFLAIIGVAGVFTNTLGFIRQRKREFARYQSVGLTPAGMRKIFCIEAAVIVGRPIVIALPVTVLSMIFMAKASYMDIGLFLGVFPVMEIAVFILAVLGLVGLAYYLGGRAILRCPLAEALRDDTFM